mmetsp:Transcript_85433/g.265614  ORF Transcript_85433/g.265614 Transcript_85433/m.265614 type:complete len:814 (+) Transcript_85433:656-3097(+)
MAQAGDPPEGRFEQADDLHRRAVPRRGGHALVARGGGGAHLVHPGAAVPSVPAVDDARGLVQPHADVEALVRHVLVDTLAGIPLPEGDALGVRREDEVHQVRDGGGLEVREAAVPALHGPLQRDGRPEEVQALGCRAAVVLDGLQEEPRRVPGVVPRAVRGVQEVGAEPVAHDAGEDEERPAGLRKAPRHQQGALERDEGVAAPVPHEARGKVRQPGCQRRPGLPPLLLRPVPVQGGAGRRAPELRRGQGEVADEPPRGAVPPDKVPRAPQHGVGGRTAERAHRHIEVEGREMPREAGDDRRHPVQPGLHAHKRRHVRQPCRQVTQQPIALTDIGDDWAALHVRGGPARQVEGPAHAHEAAVHQGAVPGHVVRAAPRPGPVPLLRVAGEEEVAQLAERQALEAARDGLARQQLVQSGAQPHLGVRVGAEHEHAPRREVGELQPGDPALPPGVGDVRDGREDLEEALQAPECLAAVPSRLAVGHEERRRHVQVRDGARDLEQPEVAREVLAEAVPRECRAGDKVGPPPGVGRAPLHRGDVLCQPLHPYLQEVLAREAHVQRIEHLLRREDAGEPVLAEVRPRDARPGALPSAGRPVQHVISVPGGVRHRRLGLVADPLAIHDELVLQRQRGHRHAQARRPASSAPPCQGHRGGPAVPGTPGDHGAARRMRPGKLDLHLGLGQSPGLGSPPGPATVLRGGRQWCLLPRTGPAQARGPDARDIGVGPPLEDDRGVGRQKLVVAAHTAGGGAAGRHERGVGQRVARMPPLAGGLVVVGTVEEQCRAAARPQGQGPRGDEGAGGVATPGHRGHRPGRL